MHSLSDYAKPNYNSRRVLEERAVQEEGRRKSIKLLFFLCVCEMYICMWPTAISLFLLII